MALKDISLIDYERSVRMSWKEKMKEFGGGDLSFLSEDGETIAFVVVGDPVLLVGKYKGKPSEKIGCPIVTEDGFSLLIAGKRLARKISKYENNFNDTGLMAIRHGEANEIETTYPVKRLEDAILTAKLFEIRDREFHPDMIDEAIVAAEAVMKQ